MRSSHSARPQPAIVQLDLASATAQDYDRLSDTIDREFGKLDGLVHAAALLGDRTPLEQYDVPTWCRVLHVNLTAPFILTQVLLPNLRKSRRRLRDLRELERCAQTACLLGRVCRIQGGTRGAAGNALPGARG